jgi:malate dehydrogenase
MRIAIVGAAGGIGSSVAYTLAMTGAVDELLLVDRNDAALETHVMDLEQLRAVLPPFEVRRASHDELRSADLVLITASVAPRKDSPRIEYLRENLRILREIAAAFERGSDWPGVVVIATNPVDPLVTEFQRSTGIDRKRVLGYTVNDSLRFRFGIALELGIEPGRVSGWVIGEHGNYCVPLFSRVTVDGQPVQLTQPGRERVRRYLLDWYPRWVALGVPRTSTWTSGQGIAAMIGAIAGDKPELWPASVVVDGEYGLGNVALGLPVQLGRGGMQGVCDWVLAPDEIEGMERAASFVSEVIAEVMPDG